jgi:hypothetical protein
MQPAAQPQERPTVMAPAGSALLDRHGTASAACARGSQRRRSRRGWALALHLPLLLGHTAQAQVSASCPDKPGYSYAIDYGWMYVTQEDFQASIWIETTSRIRDWDGQRWRTLRDSLDSNPIFSTTPYATCRVDNWDDRPGRTGESGMSCTNSSGISNGRENDLNRMAFGSFNGVPARNGLAFNTVSETSKRVFHCQSRILHVYAAGYVVRGDVLKTRYFNDDELFEDRIYYSRTSWKPYSVKLMQDAPGKSEYRF